MMCELHLILTQLIFSDHVSYVYATWTKELLHAQGKHYGGAFNLERWLDIRNHRVKSIMAKRFNFAKNVGCDGIEPDNLGANKVAWQLRILHPRVVREEL